MEPLVKRAKDEKTGVALNVYQDDLGMDSPRDWDNLGTMVCFHRSYNLGDEHSYGEPRDFLDNLAAEVATVDETREVAEKIIKQEEAPEDDEEYQEILEDLEDNLWSERAEDEDLWNIINNHAVILPLYLYDHSGITMKTKPFGCPWDSGQVGWIYATHEKIKEEFSSEHTGGDWERAGQVLRDEVEIYDQFLTGDVYGFILEQEVTCECCGNVSEEHIDSCWGFYGYESLKEELKGHVEEKYHHLIDQLESCC